MILSISQKQKIEEFVNQGYVSKRLHLGNKKIAIYCYTSKAVRKFPPSQWSKELSMCRGLIILNDRYVAARPFSKFWDIENYDINELNKDNFIATDKIDGSLGILYRNPIGCSFSIATKGAFDSPQATRAIKILNGKYPDSIFQFSRQPWLDYTFLFEIIYPENKIIIDYRNREELVLLAAIHRDTGEELPYEKLKIFGFPIPKIYKPKTIEELLKIPDNRREGFVLRFSSGLRVKLKYQNYKEKAKLINQCSNKFIWELLKRNEISKLHSFLADKNIPQELREWINNEWGALQKQFNAIEVLCQSFLMNHSEIKNQKQMAEIIKKSTYPAVCFAMYNKKNYKDIIWKLIRPKEVKFFKII